MPWDGRHLTSVIRSIYCASLGCVSRYYTALGGLTIAINWARLPTGINPTLTSSHNGHVAGTVLFVACSNRSASHFLSLSVYTSSHISPIQGRAPN